MSRHGLKCPTGSNLQSSRDVQLYKKMPRWLASAGRPDGAWGSIAYDKAKQHCRHVRKRQVQCVAVHDTSGAHANNTVAKELPTQRPQDVTVQSAPSAGTNGLGDAERRQGRQASSVSEVQGPELLATPEGHAYDEETRAEEEAGRKPGYYLQLMRDEGFDTRAMYDAEDAAQRQEYERMRFGLNRLMARTLSWRSLLYQFRDLPAMYDIINTSTALHRIAKLSKWQRVPKQLVRQEPGYSALLDHLLEVVWAMRPRQLGNVMWAMAVLGEQREDVITALIAAILRAPARRFKEQEVCNIAWALGALGRPETAVLDKFTKDAIKRGLDEFVPQGVSNLVWACASLGYLNEAFMDRVAEYVPQRIGEFTSQAVSNTIWGCSVLEYYNADLYSAVAEELRRKLPFYVEQEVSNTMMAFAKIEHVDFALMQAFETEVSRPSRLRKFVMQAFSNIMWSFATLRYYPTRAIDALCGAILAAVPNFGPQELANIVWALARLAHHPGRMLAELDQHIIAQAPNMTRQASSNLLWGLAVLQGTGLPSFQFLLDLVIQQDVETMDMVQLGQVFQAVLLAKMQMEQQPGKLSVHIKDELYEKIISSWRMQASRTKVSSFQADVSAILHAMGVAHKLEYMTKACSVAAMGEDQGQLVDRSMCSWVDTTHNRSM